MTQIPVPGLDPAIQERAGLTDRQAECLALHLKGASYRFIGDALDLEFSTAYGHVQRALRKLERAMRPDVAKPAHKAKTRTERQRLGINPFA